MSPCVTMVVLMMISALFLFAANIGCQQARWINFNHGGEIV